MNKKKVSRLANQIAKNEKIINDNNSSSKEIIDAKNKIEEIMLSLTFQELFEVTMYIEENLTI